MESRLGHAKMMVFAQECIGKKQHQKPVKTIIIKKWSILIKNKILFFPRKYFFSYLSYKILNVPNDFPYTAVCQCQYIFAYIYHPLLLLITLSFMLSDVHSFPPN